MQKSETVIGSQPRYSTRSRPGLLRLDLAKAFTRNYGFLIGGVIILVFSLLAVLAPLLPLHDPYDFDLTRRLLPPFWHDNSDPRFLLGTDKLGRDLLARLVYGARVSITVGLVAAVISGVVGTVLGLCAGYFGGRVDRLVMLLVNCRLALPVVLVALAVTVVVGSSLEMITLLIGLLLWPRFTVVIRAATMQLRDREFILASRVLGCSNWHILFREIMPNLSGTLFVIASLEMANAILLEAAVSFLGFGAQPPTSSWGLMLADSRDFILFSPWLVAMPGIALTILVLAINLVGDGLRDVLEGISREKF